MATEYKVHRVLWESLESVLLAQSKKYIGELARRLQLPEKELIRRVLPSSDSLKVYIQDSNDTTNQCKAYIQDDDIKEELFRILDVVDFQFNKPDKAVKRIYDRFQEKYSWLAKNRLKDKVGDYVIRILSSAYSYSESGSYATPLKEQDELKDKFEKTLEEMDNYFNTL